MILDVYRGKLYVQLFHRIKPVVLHFRKLIGLITETIAKSCALDIYYIETTSAYSLKYPNESRNSHMAEYQKMREIYPGNRMHEKI